MSPFASTSARRLPALLLLGLLALLLWGQCASLLFPEATRHPASFTGWVASTDSLRTTPATLYLSLSLRNDLSHPVRMREVSGALFFNGRAHPFAAPAGLRDTLLYPWTQLTQVVEIPLRLPADSVALLRTALQANRPVLEYTGLQLRWQIQYSDKQRPSARNQARTSPHLPSLKRQQR